MKLNTWQEEKLKESAIKPYHLAVVCDVCGVKRSNTNVSHARCSKIRQQRYKNN